MKRYDVTALGELLIDFTESGLSAQDNPMLEANPGGAPCNVLAMLKKLGRRCAFIGKVGNDSFGTMLADTVKACGIETKGMAFDPEVHTTLAFVHTLPGGEREFSFYRKPGADMMLKEKELDTELLKECRIFHFGSLSLTDEPCRSATQAAVRIARKAGAWISFDPNLREMLWKDLSKAKEQITWGLSECDILKISDNELEFMTGLSDLEKGAELLRECFPNIRLMFLTEGEGGSTAYYKDLCVHVPIFEVPDVIEKTGAGDTFCACALHHVLQHGLENWKEDDLRSLLTFANAAAAIITTRKGALKVMPSPYEIGKLLAQ